MTEKRTNTDSRYDAFARRVGWTLVGLVVAQLVSGGIQFFLLERDAKRGEAIAQQQRAIQDQRAESLMTSCENQNMRNRVTITKLRKLSASSPREDRTAAQIKRSLDGTIQLINALAPVQDCDKLVKERVR